MSWRSLNSIHNVINWGGSIQNISLHGVGLLFSMHVIYMAPHNGKLRADILVFSLSSDMSSTANIKFISSSNSYSLSSSMESKGMLGSSILPADTFEFNTTSNNLINNTSKHTFNSIIVTYAHNKTHITNHTTLQ
jgi:hypothetical protein